MTIGCHVDDLKLSNFDKDIVEEIISVLSKEFGKEPSLTITCGKVHHYLRITIDFLTKGQVRFYMYDYIDCIINKTPVELLKGPSYTAAANHLFNVDPNAEKFDAGSSIIYHHLVAQLLYLGKKKPS